MNVKALSSPKTRQRFREIDGFWVLGLQKPLIGKQWRQFFVPVYGNPLAGGFLLTFGRFCTYLGTN